MHGRMERYQYNVEDTVLLEDMTEDQKDLIIKLEEIYYYKSRDKADESKIP